MSGITPPPRSNSYEAKVATIEAIIQQIQSGNLEIEEVFTQFELAMQDLRQCEAFLAQRQQQMDILIENLEEES